MVLVEECLGGVTWSTKNQFSSMANSRLAGTRVFRCSCSIASLILDRVRTGILMTRSSSSVKAVGLSAKMRITMARTPFKSVDDYIDAQPPAARTALERVRSIIRKALPNAEEVISYNIPAYKQDGERVIFFAGFKEHFSLYPVKADLVATLKDELARYEKSTGTVRFPLSEPVPVKLIARIAKLRAKQAAARAKAKKTAPKSKKP
jgi:uncharacterized protein YdhG (YjbR/CyaY superfamily)